MLWFTEYARDLRHVSTIIGGCICWTHKKGGVLEGGGLWRALAVDRHSSLESCSFAHVARRQSQVLHIEGAGEEDRNEVLDDTSLH